MLKSGMLESHRLVAITEVRHITTKLHDGCVCTVHWPAVLLNLVPVSDNIKNMEYTDDGKFTEVYMCQKLS